jgi:ABC-type nitrate/sulfonate/bicarbonate transport system substrate-binding protein
VLTNAAPTCPCILWRATPKGDENQAISPGKLGAMGHAAGAGIAEHTPAEDIAVVVGTGPVDIAVVVGTGPVDIAVVVGTGPVDIAVVVGTGPVGIAVVVGTGPVGIAVVVGTGPVGIAVVVGAVAWVRVVLGYERKEVPEQLTAQLVSQPPISHHIVLLSLASLLHAARVAP